MLSGRLHGLEYDFPSSRPITLDLYGHLFLDANRSMLAEPDRLIEREPPEASITLQAW